jgi:Spx/MgsR family transcriptional regulator
MSRPLPVLHGIPNCDSVRKARAWFDTQGIAYTFHDLRRQGVPTGALSGWCQQQGWQTLLNRKGTSWRALDEACRTGVVDEASACALMASQPALIKRPVITWPDGQVSVGLDLDNFQRRAAALD